MGKITWSENALDDLTNIADYCSHFSEAYASSVISKLFNRIQILKKMPRAGRIVPEKNQDNLRELIEGNYRIIYQLTNTDEVEILLVHHSSRPLLNV